MQGAVSWWRRLSAGGRLATIFFGGLGVGLLCICCMLAYATTLGGGQAGGEAISAANTAVATGVVEQSPSPAQAPESTTVPEPTSEPTPASTTVSLCSSGGLGLGRVDFEARNGQPTRDDGMFVSYGPALTVSYFEDTAQSIDQSFQEVRRPFEEAQQLAQPYLPQDATFVERFTANTGQIIEVYTSEALKTCYPESDEMLGDTPITPWTYGEPGTLHISYRNDDAGVFGFIVAAGGFPDEWRQAP